MIVTCESCKSRYKLDDAKITGKGAKITCPKCRNVFVVYARPDAGSADGPPATPPEGPPAWEPRKSGGLADAVKAADRGAEATSSAGAPGRVVAGTGSPAPVSPSAPAGSSPLGSGDKAGGRSAPGTKPAPPRSKGFDEAPTAWDDEPTRVGGVTPPPEEAGHEVRRPATPAAAGTPTPTPPAGPPAGSTPAASAFLASRDPAQIAARAATLDFRKVGVTTWKVKVKIGLIYDFSDIKTLRKYIQDGRVTPADVVSWDGKSWRAIGEIPDLDAFFVETWDALAARKVESPTLNPAPAAAEAPRAEEPSGGTPKPNEPTQFQDPFAAQKRKKAAAADARRTAPVVTPPPKAAEPAPGSRMPLVALALLCVLLVVGGTAWWMSQAPATPVGAAPKPATPAGPAKTPDQIRKELEDKLKTTVANNPVPEEEAPRAVPGDDPLPGGAEPTRGAPPDRADRTPVIPEGAVPRPNPRGANSTAPAGMQQADPTAADHEAVGDDAANGGDWATAAQAYQKAVALDKKSTKLAGKLGRALYETGDLAGAQAQYERAAAGGSKEARKYLGHIARKNGDTAGANTQYALYLEGSPKDAAEIKQIIAQMSGG